MPYRRRGYRPKSRFRRFPGRFKGIIGRYKRRRFQNSVRAIVMRTTEPKVAYTRQTLTPLGDNITNVPNNSTYKVANNLLLGDNSYNREGNEVIVTGFHMKWQILPATDLGTSSFNTIRILVWSVRPGARVPVTGDQDAEYMPLGIATHAFTTAELNTFIADESEFTVWKDQTIIHKNRIGEASATGDSSYLIEPIRGSLHVGLNKKYIWRDITDPTGGVVLGAQFLESWPVYITFLSDSNVTPHPELFFELKTHFKDV